MKRDCAIPCLSYCYSLRIVVIIITWMNFIDAFNSVYKQVASILLKACPCRQGRIFSLLWFPSFVIHPFCVMIYTIHEVYTKASFVRLFIYLFVLFKIINSAKEEEEEKRFVLKSSFSMELCKCSNFWHTSIILPNDNLEFQQDQKKVEMK